MPQLWVRPGLEVCLLLPGESAQLDHRGAVIRQRQQDLLALGSFTRHLRLGREDHRRCGVATASGGDARRPVRQVQERQGGQSKRDTDADVSRDGGEVGDLTVTVQQKEVAAGPEGHGAAGGRDTEAR